jgi:enoyl-CoA hydratase/carnithine racemase
MPDKKMILEEISEDEGIAWITFNRPEKKNALSRALIAELCDSLEALRHNGKIRCIVTKGAGDSYSSGRDLYDMRAGAESDRRREGGANAEVVRLLRACPQITIAAVQGYCLGGGLAVINGHDLAIAADTAQLGMPEIIRGSYGATATPTLFHSGIPFKKAFYVQLTGRNLTGLEAERVGLVSLAVPEKELMPFVRELAGEIASRNAAALEHAKLAAYMEMDMEFHTALRADDLVAHRMRFYTNPLSDVEGYMESQKGGGSLGYVKREKKN